MDMPVRRLNWGCGPNSYEFAQEMLLRAGFTSVTRCELKQTASRYPEIVARDDRHVEQQLRQVEAASA